MKIGRNDPCPCGSGKKYKKCCLIKNTKNTLLKSSLTVETDFEYIVPMAEELYERIKDYNYQDLIVAIFCLNLWRRNRSALGQALTLHLMLFTDKAFGVQCINEYSDFEVFFSKISDLLSITYREDYIIDDYGEIFINHNGTAYPVIIGTGYLQVYSMIRYLQTLAHMRGVDEDFGAILSYYKTIIEFTKGTNIPNTSREIVYELPSNEFWITIKDLFDNVVFQEQFQKVVEILKDYNGPIESRSFVERNNKCYPLLNHGILTDYYKLLLSSASNAERHDHVIKTIHSLLEATYNFENEPPTRILINPKILSSDLQTEIINKGLIFATATKDTIVIAVDQNTFSTDVSFVKTISSSETGLDPT